MSRRTTYRGHPIDMEALRQINEKSIAMGNMGVNAKGDKLGPGGKVVQTAQQRTRIHYTTPQSTSKGVSIKGDEVADALFPEETKTKTLDKTTAKDEPKKKNKKEGSSEGDSESTPGADQSG